MTTDTNPVLYPIALDSACQSLEDAKSLTRHARTNAEHECRRAKQHRDQPQPDAGALSAALYGIMEARKSLEHAQHDLVTGALAAGMSYADLAGILGISRQAVRQRYGVSAT